MEQNTSNKNGLFLKIVSILMIVGGAATIVLGIMALGLSACANAIAAQAETTANTGALTLAGILLIIAGIVELIAGIVGVGASKDPSKAKGCLIWGIIVIVLTVISTIITMVNGGKFDAVSLVTGLALPVAYIVASFIARKDA